MFTLEEVRSYYKDEIMLNDKAHNLDHVDSVYLRAMQIKQKMFNDLDIDHLILLGVYIHDLKCHVSRVNHHTLAAGYIQKMRNKDKFLKKLTNDELALLESAVLKHRASLKGAVRTSPLSKILYAADKDAPDINTYIARSMKFHGDSEDLADNVAKHLKEKFGTGGYNVFGGIFTEMYGADMVEQLRTDVDNCRVEVIGNVKRIVY